MKKFYNFTAVNLLSAALDRQIDFLTTEEIALLTELSVLKIQAAERAETAAEDYIQKIETINFNLEKELASAMNDDPLLVKAETKPDVTYTILNQPLIFKIDTGAVTSVVDAENIQWPLDDAQRAGLENAYVEYVKTHEDDGAMTADRLPELAPEFHGLDFGQVLHFDLVAHRKGKDDTGNKDDKDKDTILVPIDGTFPVVGISNPKVKGERLGLRPVVALPVAGPGFDDASVYPFSLNKRDMSRRGLLSRTQLRATKMGIIFDDRDTRVIELDKVNVQAVLQILKV